MGSVRPDLSCRVYPEPVDHFNRLPNSLILLVFNMIGDVKALGRCCVVSKRFHSLVPLVDNVVVRVDCVISEEDGSSLSSAAAAADSASDLLHPPPSVHGAAQTLPISLPIHLCLRVPAARGRVVGHGRRRV
nr:F-box protein At4g18380-like [Ipomoea trifida]